MAKSRHYYIRKSHRYLGVVLGIQFLFWTVGGLYFSWTNIDEIHGDFQHKHVPRLTGNLPLVSPSEVFHALPAVDSIQSLQLIQVLGKPCYSLTYFSAGKQQKALADATTGTVRGAITKEEAVQVAAQSFHGEPEVKQVEYLTSTHGHHEYREKPLPAWAITFDHPTNTTVYVSADIGKVESFRNDKWRVFDFLWMMHTMDYENRDNINNWLLRIFSVFGLLTIASGFILFWISRKGRLRSRRATSTKA
ncbi:hypothetical protein [Aridibaculum aurantiacum]|uniref:hypothetical protein n=1 Tax=Aridibaculum aurantiacum TaxID=2810307 RepID=UPI001A963439|nr:hypothetical protein [Aridibaculum aurantiacum]